MVHGRICDRTESLPRGASDTGTHVPSAARCLLHGPGSARSGNSYRTDASECENPNMNGNVISDIVTFWLSDSRDCPARALARRDRWYDGGATVDEEIRVRFGDLVPRACAREFTDWRDTPDGALALILLLDQFTRNLYRGTVEAYAGDPVAFEVVNHAIDRRTRPGAASGRDDLALPSVPPLRGRDGTGPRSRTPAGAAAARHSGVARLCGAEH